jgi:hypothetical protein
MESINSNPYFQPARLAQLYNQPGNAPTGKSSEHVDAKQIHPKAVTKTQAPQAIASLFDDSDLERLQKNLESIAQLAEKSLKRIEGGGL